MADIDIVCGRYGASVADMVCGRYRRFPNTNSIPILNPNPNPNPKPYTIIIAMFQLVFQQISMYIGAVVLCCMFYMDHKHQAWLVDRFNIASAKFTLAANLSLNINIVQYW